MQTWNIHTWGRASAVAGRPSRDEFFPLALGAVKGAQRKNETDKPVGATVASPYRELPNGEVLEASRLRIVGRPSLNLYQNMSGATVVALRRNITNMAGLGDDDLGFIQAYGDAVLAQLKAMSRGPLSLRDLRRMGHPFGFEKSWAKGDKEFVGRKVPRFERHLFGGKAVGHVKGVRGSVPTLSVVNRQSGAFERAWNWDWKRDANGFEIRFWNSMKYSWWLAHGTLRMQPHGPFTYAPLTYLRQLDSDIQRAIAKARSREAGERLTREMLSAAEL